MNDQTIFRVVRPEKWATFAVEGTFIRDKRLSWAARGMLTYLLSKPNDWEVRLSDLVNQCEAKRSNRFAVLSIIKELKTTGYMKRFKRKNRFGHFMTKTYVGEVPFSENFSPPDEPPVFPGFLPCVGYPHTDDPTADERSADNRAVYERSNDLGSNNEILNKDAEPAPAAPAAAVIVKTQDVVEVFGFWQTWCEHPDAKLIPGKHRDKAIRDRMKEGYDRQYIKLAIIGVTLIPHNMGLNDRHRKFDDIELICRSSIKLEQFHDEAVRHEIDDPDAWVERMSEARRRQAEEAQERLYKTEQPSGPAIMPPPPAAGTVEFSIIEKLKAKMATQTFDTWFRPLSLKLDAATKTMNIAAPNPVVRDWIASHYVLQLAEAVGEGIKIEWSIPARNGNKS